MICQGGEAECDWGRWLVYRFTYEYTRSVGVQIERVCGLEAVADIALFGKSVDIAGGVVKTDGIGFSSKGGAS